MPWAAGLQEHQEGEGLEGVVAAVHEVAHEDVVGALGGLAPDPEQLQEVEELPVDVRPAPRHRGGRCGHRRKEFTRGHCLDWRGGKKYKQKPN